MFYRNCSAHFVCTLVLAIGVEVGISIGFDRKPKNKVAWGVPQQLRYRPR